MLDERIKSCTDSCVARAKAAVDPEVAARFKGTGCARNCSRQEVFEQHGCPEPEGR